MKHFISVEYLSKAEIIELLELTKELKESPIKLTKQIFAANLFFEPSTRTKMSFMVAEKKLGIETLDFSVETSSMEKGESLYDTAKTFESIGADFLVVRHVDDNWIDKLGSGIRIPMINAGSGQKDHPTQSLLDAYTIYEEFGRIDGLQIVISGDIKHSRVARSNAEMLTKLGATVYFSGARDFYDETLGIPYITMDEAIQMCDVLMLLRIQHERHNNATIEVGNYLEKYGLTKEREQLMKDQAIVLHPAPVNRGVEIDSDLVECGRSRIFKQMENGTHVRQAVITKQLLNWGIIHDNQIEKCKPIITRGQIRKV